MSHRLSADGVRSHLVYLGRIEANIPLDILFPSSTTHREVEARFIFSIKPEGQLLKVEVSLQLENGPRLLKKTYVPAASWTPQSELDLESRHVGSPVTFSRAKRPRRAAKKRRLFFTVNAGIAEDRSLLQQPAVRFPRLVLASPAIAPVSLVPSVNAEKDVSLSTLDRRLVEKDVSVNGISLPSRNKVVRRRLGPKNMGFLLSPQV